MVLAFLGLLLVEPCAAQVLETETARLRLPGAVQGGLNYEFQTSAEGHESAVPFLFEYGITDRLELAVEPVAATRIRPRVGPKAAGFGDTEMTLTYLAMRESRSFPALAFAGEIKFGTARNPLIGTGEPDYAAYLIASKRFGRLDTHFNLTYTFVGQPPGPEMTGSKLSNTIGGALAGMYTVGARFRIYRGPGHDVRIRWRCRGAGLADRNPASRGRRGGDRRNDRGRLLPSSEALHLARG